MPETWCQISGTGIRLFSKNWNRAGGIFDKILIFCIPNDFFLLIQELFYRSFLYSCSFISSSRWILRLVVNISLLYTYRYIIIYIPQASKVDEIITHFVLNFRLTSPIRCYFQSSQEVSSKSCQQKAIIILSIFTYLSLSLPWLGIPLNPRLAMGPIGSGLGHLGQLDRNILDCHHSSDMDPHWL